MKVTKLLFIFTLVSMIAFSCKEAKKQEVTEDSVEMTEEGSEAAPATGDEASDSEGAAEAAETMEEAKGIEGDTKGVDEFAVPEGVIAEELADTPIVYAGCSGTVEEIRACNKESFIAYIKGEFNHEIAKQEGLKKGDYKIGVVLHVNKAGRVFSLRVTAPHPALKTEMERVVNKTPHATPATKGGEPVGVSVKLVVDFKVEKL